MAKFEIRYSDATGEHTHTAKGAYALDTFKRIVAQCGGTIHSINGRRVFASPHDALRHHVTGAIERGEAEAIIGIDA